MVTQEERDAFRKIYQHYGRDKVLDDDLVLVNAVGDFLGSDGKRLRNQLKFAVNAGINHMYLEQLANPTAYFDARVRTMLCDAGLSDEASKDINELYNYMVCISDPTVISSQENKLPLAGEASQDQEESTESNLFSPSSAYEKYKMDPHWYVRVPLMTSPVLFFLLAIASFATAFLAFLGCYLDGYYSSWENDFVESWLSTFVATSGLCICIAIILLCVRIFGKKHHRLIVNQATDGRIFCVPGIVEKIDSVGIAVDGRWIAFDPNPDGVYLSLPIGKHRIKLIGFFGAKTRIISSCSIKVKESCLNT